MMTMIMERTEIRPLLVKFGVVVAISFAGYLYARNRTKRIKPSDYPHSPPPQISESDTKVDYGRFRIKDDPQPEVDSDDTYDKPCIQVCVDHASMSTSLNDTHSEDKDEFLLSEVDKLVKEFDTSTTNPILTSPKTHKRDEHEHEHEHEHEQEIENLKMIINFLQDRQRNLEVQLLEYYGLKEQETAMMELQNLLEISNMKAKLFTMKIESLEADNKRLEAQCVDYSKVLSELEAAKAKIKLLKRKIRYEDELNKEHILDLTERVVKLQEQEHEATISDSNVQLELQRLKDLECEAEELRKSNENLQQENNDLARRLESTQVLAISVLEDTEKEELNKAILQLREENENLANEIERLKADQCSNAGELVHLQWINACLRHELKKYQPPPGKTVARDLASL